MGEMVARWGVGMSSLPNLQIFRHQSPMANTMIMVAMIIIITIIVTTVIMTTSLYVSAASGGQCRFGVTHFLFANPSVTQSFHVPSYSGQYHR